MYNWISVKDRLPKEYKNYLVLINNESHDIYEFILTSGNEEWISSCGDFSDNVTHWQPLPQPPKEI